MTWDERMHREVDRENTPEESQRLYEELERQPEARARYEELRELVRTLATVPAEDPPSGLVAGVMRAVRAKGVPSSGIAGVVAAWREAFARRPVLGLSLTMATGLLVGALLGRAGELGQLHLGGDDRAAAGTMIAPNPPGLREVDRTELVGEGFRGEAALWAAGDQAEVRVRLEGQPPLDLAVTCDGQELEPTGLERARGAPGQMQLGAASLHVAEAGPGYYVLKLAVRKTPAQVEIALGRGQARVVAALKVSGGS